MARSRSTSPIVRWVVNATGLLLIGYLAAVALWPSIVDALPKSLRWFGRPGSTATMAIVVAVVVAVCVLTFGSDGSHRLIGVSFTVVAVLIGITAVLSLSAYWRCHDARHPAFFTALMATAQLIRVGFTEVSMGGRSCPSPTPIGLEVARMAALSAFFTALGGVVVGVFRSQVDRLRANLAVPSPPSSASTTTLNR